MGDRFEVVLTRGLEPPRVAPYGSEPYASAIPPRERGLVLSDKGTPCAMPFLESLVIPMSMIARISSAPRQNNPAPIFTVSATTVVL